MGTPGAKLVASDISCDSLFARLPLKNPLEPTIEWEKHQTPEKWAALLEDAGFRDPWIRWNSLNTLRRPGRIVLGNRVGAWLLGSGFCLTMTLSPARTTSAGPEDGRFDLQREATGWDGMSGGEARSRARAEGQPRQ
jgi:hypothetical protein